MLHPFDQLKIKAEPTKDDSAAQLISFAVLAAGLFMLLRKPEEKPVEGLEDFREVKNPYTVTDIMKGRARSYYALGFIRIEPKDFLALTTGGLNFGNRVQRIYEDNRQRNFSYNDYEDMHKESQVVHPFLSVNVDTGEVTGHEGRHRAAAAVEAGEDFYIYILPDYESKTQELKDDVLAGDGAKYIPDVLSGQFDSKIKVKLDKSTMISMRDL